MGEITLSTSEFKALSSESRTKILKLLEERNHTLTELSGKLEMASPTVKQHLNVLVESGLIELRDEGRKWKYYALTRKGKNITSPADQTHFLIILSFASIALIALLGFVFYPLLVPVPGVGSDDMVLERAPVQALVTAENSLFDDSGQEYFLIDSSEYHLLNNSANFHYQAMMSLCEPECEGCDIFEGQCDHECERCIMEQP